MLFYKIGMAQKSRYKFDPNTMVLKVLEDRLNDLKIDHKPLKVGEIVFLEKLTKQVKEELLESLSVYGITLIADKKEREVERIREAIQEMIYENDEGPKLKSSAFLESKLHKSYSSIAKLFKEYTYTSIENYIILQKVERSKELIISEQHTLTEIAFLLNYSSVAHLSNQFKKTTGLSASTFLRIIKMRREKKA